MRQSRLALRLDDGSRMSGDVHVRFCESLGVKFPRATHPLRVLAALGGVFGLATLREGGLVLFGSGATRAAAGDYVDFVVWFNFLAGFAYVIAGTGLAFRRPWAVRMA